MKLVDFPTLKCRTFTTFSDVKFRSVNLAYNNLYKAYVVLRLRAIDHVGLCDYSTFDLAVITLYRAYDPNYSV